MHQGRQVIADIKRIRVALAEKGDRLQKLPKQAVWVIRRANNKSYRLTYQVAPLKGWAISPPDRDASQLLGIIDRALDYQKGYAQRDEALAPLQTAYQQQLHPWCIIQWLPQMQHRVVARFRRRNDADAHLRILRQHTPSLQYVIIFDPAMDKIGVGIDG